VSDHEQHDDEFDDELERLAPEPLRVEAIDPETGERVEGVIYRDHLAQAQIERDESEERSCPTHTQLEGPLALGSSGGAIPCLRSAR
jgi:hypothetical protein